MGRPGGAAPDDLAAAVAVVVASWDRRAELLAPLPRHEAPVVLVDDGSRDGTVDAVRAALPAVGAVLLAADRGAAASTPGAARAGTRCVAFADDDSWWAPGSLARAVELLDAAPLGTEPGLPGPNPAGSVACAAVVRREAFSSVGGFDHVVVFPGEEERAALDPARDGWGLGGGLRALPRRPPPPDGVGLARHLRATAGADHPVVGADGPRAAAVGRRRRRGPARPPPPPPAPEALAARAGQG